MSTQSQKEETAERFFKLIEAGDLAFLDIIQFAFVVFGCTKHGKTTLSHYLTNNALVAYKQQGGQTHYKLLTSKGLDAKIGQTSNSQTQIPNRFRTDVEQNGKPVYLIDCPGQKDSFGISRVLSNAYFYYRIFSKIKNMKFVLVFDYVQFSSNSLNQVHEVFGFFFKSFSNFKAVQGCLLQSTAIMFTKVGKKKSKGDIKERIKLYIKTIKQCQVFKQEQFKFIKSLLQQCVTQTKFQIFRKAEVGVQLPKSKQLSRIHQKFKFFSRQPLQNEQFKSVIDQQRVISMQNIKFSQSKKILTLTLNQRQNQRIKQLFQQLNKRGTLMFASLFQLSEQLLDFIFFNYDQQLAPMENKLTQTNPKIERAKQSFTRILSGLQNVSIEYSDQEKYREKRQSIIEKYFKLLKSTEKSRNFIQRLQLAGQIYKFLIKYTDTGLFRGRSYRDIKRAKIDFQNIILKVSKLYSKDQQIRVLAGFLYNLNNFMNQMIVFTMIIIKNNDHEGNDRNKIKTQNSIDPSLTLFLMSLQTVGQKATEMNDLMQYKIKKHYKLQSASDWRAQKDVILKCHFKKFNSIILQQNSHQQGVLMLLRQINLDKQHEIHTQILKFKLLQKKYYYLFHTECSQPKKSASGKRSKQSQIKVLIKSFIFYLTSVKNLRQLVELRDFQYLKNEVYKSNYQIWIYLMRLFYALYEIEKQDLQKQNCEQADTYLAIVVEILSISKNYDLMSQIFAKFYEKNFKVFEQIAFQNVNTTNQKQSSLILKSNQDCYIQFVHLKNEVSKILIDKLLLHASMLNDLNLGEEALKQCHKAIKFIEFCYEYLPKIQDMMQKINDNSQKLKTFKNQDRSLTIFEASLTIKKQLTCFLKQNSEIKVFKWVEK